MKKAQWKYRMETQNEKWKRTPPCRTHKWKRSRCQECGAVKVIPESSQEVTR